MKEKMGELVDVRQIMNAREDFEMAFLEGIGRRLTDVGQNVAQQTKNLADVTQLNSAVSEKEKKILQLFLKIGQAYYEKHKSDEIAEELEEIREINALYSEIFQNREKINQIKGVTKCQHCGANVPLNAIFCNGCGTKIVLEASLETPVINTESNRHCPNCHSIVANDNVFCNVCGTKIEEGE